MHLRRAWALALGCLIGGVVRGGETQPPDSRAINTVAVAEWHAQCAAEHAGDPDSLLRPGLMANRKTKRVEFFAEATGIGPGETMEFFLIGEQSGNAYEALAISLAQPLDIYDALLFVGLPPGRGVDYNKLQFWPKGERVVMTIEGQRAESLMINSDTGKPLDAFGLVFTGSQFIPTAPEEDSTALAAQIAPPYSIASNYNEPYSILDVPFAAPQTAVYSKQMLNPKCAFAEGDRLHVVIEPEYKDGKCRVRELQLHIGRGTCERPSLVTAQLTLQKLGGSTAGPAYSLAGLLERLSDMTDNGHDPFVSIDIANDVTVGQLNELALLLQAIDTDRGIRVEPPSQGQLYYKAFAPNEAYRNRDERFLQPWELRLAPSADGVVTGMLTEITEIWTQGVAKPEIETEEHAVASPKALVELMTSRKPDVKVLLIYASRSLSYDALMRYVGPVYATHPIVYVYTEPKENSTAVE